jgi:hypothetical protein
MRPIHRKPVDAIDIYAHPNDETTLGAQSVGNLSVSLHYVCYRVWRGSESHEAGGVMPDLSLDSRKTALVVIDLQNALGYPKIEGILDFKVLVYEDALDFVKFGSRGPSAGAFGAQAG